MPDTPADLLVRSWRRSLRARNRSDRTIESYVETVEQFLAYTNLADPAAATRAQIDGWLAHLVETRSSATAALRYRSLKVFFNWLVDEDDRRLPDGEAQSAERPGGSSTGPPS